MLNNAKQFWWIKMVSLYYKTVYDFNVFIFSVCFYHQLSGYKFPNLDLLLRANKETIKLPEEIIKSMSTYNIDVYDTKIEKVGEKYLLVNNLGETVILNYKYSGEIPDPVLHMEAFHIFNYTVMTEGFYKELTKQNFDSECFIPKEASYFHTIGKRVYNLKEFFSESLVGKKIFLGCLYREVLDIKILKKIDKTFESGPCLILAYRKNGTPLCNHPLAKVVVLEKGKFKISNAYKGAIDITSQEASNLVLITNTKFDKLGDFAKSIESKFVEEPGLITFDTEEMATLTSKFKHYYSKIKECQSYNSYIYDTNMNKLRLDMYKNEVDFEKANTPYIVYDNRYLIIDDLSIYSPKVRYDLISEKIGKEHYPFIVASNFLWNINIPEVVYLYLKPYFEVEGMTNGIVSHALKYDMPYYTFIKEPGSKGKWTDLLKLNKKCLFYVPLWILPTMEYQLTVFKSVIIITTYIPDHPYFVVYKNNRVIYTAGLEKFGNLWIGEDIAIFTNMDIDLKKIEWPLLIR